MKIIRYQGDKVIWLFGLGLVGSGIYQEIKLQFDVLVLDVLFKWECVEDISSSISKIKKATSSTDITVIWVAGKAGFLSKYDEIQSELIFFDRFISELAMLNLNLDFIFISSGGALYEGSLNIDYTTPLSIDSYYGELKYEQEEVLKKSHAFSNLCIIRPSSIYGLINNQRRMGLIPTIISNVILNKTTKLFGSIYTLRDYVWVGDVANFVVNLLSLKADRDRMYILANSKPTSILEITRYIEVITRKKVYFQINEALNSRNITFSKMNEMVKSVSVVEGISKILLLSARVSKVH